MSLEITQAIKNTFKLGANDDISALRNVSMVTRIRGLPALIALLSNDRNPPKIVAEALEEVVLQIKRENVHDRTQHERELLKQLKELYYDPMYKVEEPEPGHTTDLRSFKC